METSYAIVTLFLVGFVFGVRSIIIFILAILSYPVLYQPILWGPGSELVGRRPIFMVSLSCYTLFHIGQALSKNIQTLLICRFFAGFFAVAPLTISGGTCRSSLAFPTGCSSCPQVLLRIYGQLLVEVLQPVSSPRAFSSARCLAHWLGDCKPACLLRADFVY